MRAFAVLFALVVFAAVAYAAPDSNGDCHDDILNLDVKRGEVVYPEGKCLRVSCSEKGQTRVEPCEFAIGPSCRVVDGDPKQQFPGCCPTVKCD